MKLDDDQTPRNLSLLLDLPVEVHAVLGTTRMEIRNILQLGQGSLVELTKEGGDPIDLLVNGKVFARGETVIVGERIGIRILDITDRKEVMEQLGR